MSAPDTAERRGYLRHMWAFRRGRLVCLRRGCKVRGVRVRGRIVPESVCRRRKK